MNVNLVERIEYRLLLTIELMPIGIVRSPNKPTQRDVGFLPRTLEPTNIAAKNTTQTTPANRAATSARLSVLLWNFMLINARQQATAECSTSSDYS